MGECTILAVLENFEIPDNSREKDDGRFYEKVALLLEGTEKVITIQSSLRII